jgi:hypothetical protein
MTGSVGNSRGGRSRWWLEMADLVSSMSLVPWYTQLTTCARLSRQRAIQRNTRWGSSTHNAPAADRPACKARPDVHPRQVELPDYSLSSSPACSGPRWRRAVHLPSRQRPRRKRQTRKALWRPSEYVQLQCPSRTNPWSSMSLSPKKSRSARRASTTKPSATPDVSPCHARLSHAIDIKITRRLNAFMYSLQCMRIKPS